MPEHTPAPWYVEMPVAPSRVAYVWDRPPLNDDELLAGKSRLLIASFLVDDAQDAANLRLIAAAPDLLAACKAAVETIDDDAAGPGLTERQLLTMLRSAIAKAEEAPDAP